ncbi:MAG: biotin/lipoyl-containing protein [Acidobacteriota bacterium]
MKYKFQLDKKNFETIIASSTTFHSETEIKVNKAKASILIGEYDDNGIKSFFYNNRLYQVEIEKDSEGYPTGIYVNGEHYSSNLLKIDKLFYYKDKPVVTKKSGIVKSFIPGNIVKIFFNEGDKVKEGDLIMIHEAMKMENEMRAPVSGKLKIIGVKEGDNILASHLLFEIE